MRLAHHPRRSLAEVAWAQDAAGTYYAAPLPDGPVLRMDGSAAAIFDVVLTLGESISAQEIALALASELDDVPGDLESQVEDFLVGLARAGLLTDGDPAH